MDADKIFLLIGGLLCTFLYIILTIYIGCTRSNDITIRQVKRLAKKTNKKKDTNMVMNTEQLVESQP
ncbi:hypothetical protein SS50377_25645 [Spironucleus salmonicida]|uniref:Uncharacterized protein n=1 Tax=Spironucleus salmonicida TaxID=348837 RepID=A0A9P8RW92_9EUKA|nr:hypothetical protein SS50377_25645 [Spironucleus salmonicida]